MSYLKKQNSTCVLAMEGENFLVKTQGICVVLKDKLVEIFKVESNCTITTGFKTINSLDEFDSLFNTIKMHLLTTS